jgi:hypothetical protein
MNLISKLLSFSKSNFIIIDSDHLDPNWLNYISFPEILLNSPYSSQKLKLNSVIRAGEFFHAGESEDIFLFLFNLIESPLVVNETTLILDGGDIIFKKMSPPMIENIINSLTKKNLKMISSFQNVYDIFEFNQIRSLCDFCDRFFFCSYYIDVFKNSAVYSFFKGKDPTNNFNSLSSFEISEIFPSLMPEKDVFYLGPESKGFVDYSLNQSASS